MTAEYIHCNLLTSINLVCKGRIIMLCLRDAMQNIFIFLYLIVSGGKKKNPCYRYDSLNTTVFLFIFSPVISE